MPVPRLLGDAGGVFDPLDAGIFRAAAIAGRLAGDAAVMDLGIGSDPGGV